MIRLEFGNADSSRSAFQQTAKFSPNRRILRVRLYNDENVGCIVELRKAKDQGKPRTQERLHCSKHPVGMPLQRFRPSRWVLQAVDVHHASHAAEQAAYLFQ